MTVGGYQVPLTKRDPFAGGLTLRKPGSVHFLLGVGPNPYDLGQAPPRGPLWAARLQVHRLLALEIRDLRRRAAEPRRVHRSGLGSRRANAGRRVSARGALRRRLPGLLLLPLVRKGSARLPG